MKINYTCYLCGCNFFSKDDYDEHMNAFGYDFLIHVALFKILHHETVKRDFITRYTKIEGRLKKQTL